MTFSPRLSALPLSFVALSGLVLSASGCIEDTDCGICDPDNLVLESISGVNYDGEKVHVLSPTCEGDKCPEPFDKGRYFVERIGPCLETDEAIASPRGPDEYCRIAPNVAAYGLEFVFNNLLDPTSVEWTRKNPGNPELYQVYDWKTRIVGIAGPTTRFSGDYYPGRGEDPDLTGDVFNLACIENLRDLGIPFDHTTLENDPDICNTLAAADATDEDPAGNVYTSVKAGQPLKTRFGQQVQSYRGEWDWRAQEGWCDPPQEGPDLCCHACDYEQSVNVAKYGLITEPGPNSWALGRAQVVENMRNFNAGTAIACDPMAGDKYIACEEFIPWVDRREDVEVGRVYDYVWDGEEKDVPVPLYDRLRETHPEDRPAWTQDKNVVPCTATAECTDANGPNLPGTECIGHMSDDPGQACDPSKTPGCVEGKCSPEWFVTCKLDAVTTGSDSGYCVDRRFSDRGAAACFIANSAFVRCSEEGCDTLAAGNRVAACNGNDDTEYNATECCQASLGASADGAACDPMTLSNLTPIDIFDRKASLPDETKGCRCVDEQRTPQLQESCREFVDETCKDKAGNMRPDRAGEYAIKFVTKQGGLVYDPSLKGVEWRLGHLGGIPRGTLEDCAETISGGVGKRNVQDGWRAHDDIPVHRFEDYDRALCSSSEYRVQFALDGEHVQDKVGNTLEGKDTYVFTTPDFHIDPGSGFPKAGLRIGSCDAFSLKFSNKYDLSPENLKKIQLIEVRKYKDAGAKDAYTPYAKGLGGDCNEADWETGACEFHVVAGGPGCTDDPAVWIDDKENNPPCLVVDVANQYIGEVKVTVDSASFRGVLDPQHSYRMFVPYVVDMAEMNDPVRYRQAFWDACGMPLVAMTGDFPDGPEGEAARQRQRLELAYDFDIDEPKCREDEDRDQISLSCDNAQDYFNPLQEDMDLDGFGDVYDICATIAQRTNSADSDVDGVGNDCDNCRQKQDRYNADDVESLGIPPNLVVRNIPFQADSDQDGIGDVCDNCVWTPNCEDYDDDNPWDLGDPIDVEDAVNCNRDDDQNMIGDLCEGANASMRPGAAGPVGFGDADDFDQDGLANALDGCPRQPVEPIACTASADCPPFTKCETAAGICDHVDTDEDGVGNFCDTCPFVSNPTQVMVLGGAETDDPEGDFIGSECESYGECSGSKDPRPYSFYEVAAGGYCCITQLVEIDGILYPRQPDGTPLMSTPLVAPTKSIDDPPVYIKLECDEAQEEAGECKRLPDAVRNEPGVLTLPTGCAEALEAAGETPDSNVRLGPDHPSIADDLGLLWSRQCFLPPWDQDFDALHDKCDLCPFDFDPQNTPYQDANLKIWPTNGAVCSGEFQLEKRCESAMDTDTDTVGGTSGQEG